MTDQESTPEEQQPEQQEEADQTESPPSEEMQAGPEHPLAGDGEQPEEGEVGDDPEDLYEFMEQHPDLPDPVGEDEMEEILSREAGKQEVGEIDDQTSYEEGSIYATFRLPGGGITDSNGVQDILKVREMSGREDMILTDARQQGQGVDNETLEQLVVECAEHFGQYTDKGKINQLVQGDLLVSDFIFILFKLRQLSVGNEFKFPYECPRPTCNGSGSTSFSLADIEYFLPLVPTPKTRHQQSTLEHHGMEFTFHWHWMTQQDARFIRRMRDHLKEQRKEMQRLRDRNMRRFKKLSKMMPDVEELDIITIGIVARLDRYEDPDGNVVEMGRRPESEVSGDQPTMLESIEKVQNLPTALRIELYKEFDALEPAVDTDVWFDCEQCGQEIRMDAYPLDPNFFFPSDIQRGSAVSEKPWA